MDDATMAEWLEKTRAGIVQLAAAMGVSTEEVAQAVRVAAGVGLVPPPGLADRLMRASYPRIIRLALLPDEVACYDSDDGQWYGVKDGDHEEWRNVRPLGIYGDEEPGRHCDVPSACGEFSDEDKARESRPCSGCDWIGCQAGATSDG